MRCDIQDMSSVSKRDNRCFFFTPLKEEGGFRKDNDHVSIPCSVFCFPASVQIITYFLNKRW